MVCYQSGAVFLSLITQLMILRVLEQLILLSVDQCLFSAIATVGILNEGIVYAHKLRSEVRRVSKRSVCRLRISCILARDHAQLLYYVILYRHNRNRNLLQRRGDQQNEL